MPAAKTVTKVTTARPIISAAAVTAVRLRVALRVLAREAAESAGAARSSGQPATRGQRRHEARG